MDHNKQGPNPKRRIVLGFDGSKNAEDAFKCEYTLQ